MRLAPAIAVVGGCLFAAQGPREDAARLQGIVQDENGSWVVGAEVRLLATGTQNEVAGVRSGSRGSFVLQEIPRGTYDLQLYSVGFVRTTVRGLTLADGESKRLPPITMEVGGTGCSGWYPLWQRFLEPGSPPGSELVSMVVGEDGKPLSGAVVSLSGPSQGRQSLTTPDGMFHFKGLEPGNYRIHARREEYFDRQEPPVPVRSGFLYQHPPVGLTKCLDPQCDPAQQPPAELVCE